MLSETLVYSPIAKSRHKLPDKQEEEWRKRLELRSTFGEPRKKGKFSSNPRAAATINRDIVPFRAALNMALDRGDVLTARAHGDPH